MIENSNQDGALVQIEWKDKEAEAVSHCKAKDKFYILVFCGRDIKLLVGNSFVLRFIKEKSFKKRMQRCTYSV